jgi:hypothetical protein
MEPKATPDDLNQYVAGVMKTYLNTIKRFEEALGGILERKSVLEADLKALKTSMDLELCTEEDLPQFLRDVDDLTPIVKAERARRELRERYTVVEAEVGEQKTHKLETGQRISLLERLLGDVVSRYVCEKAGDHGLDGEEAWEIQLFVENVLFRHMYSNKYVPESSDQTDPIQLLEEFAKEFATKKLKESTEPKCLVNSSSINRWLQQMGDISGGGNN